MHPVASRLLCATLSLASACPARAVTGARILVDNVPTGANTTYMASVNDTDQPITLLGTDYGSLYTDADIAIGDIPPHSSPSRGAETDYTRSHPVYQSIGLGFDHAFPNGASGGYRYRLQCSRVGFADICHLAPGSQAITRYRTTCNGKPLHFKVTAWAGRDRGSLGATLALLGTTAVSAPVLDLLSFAYEVGGAAYISSHYPGAISLTEIEDIAEHSYWLPNPANTAMRGAIARTGPVVAFLALLTYFELASRFDAHGAMYADDSYINFSADADSVVTATLADTELEQHIVIDDCLEIEAIAQDLPYLSRHPDARLVPDLNDALVTAVFRRKLPEISAARSCALATDDSATRFTGACSNRKLEWLSASLDASGCVNAADIANLDGVLTCTGERIPKPLGSYLRDCHSIAWDGARLAATCGTLDALVRTRLDYAGQCREGSTVRYQHTGIGSFARGRLSCDLPR